MKRIFCLFIALILCAPFCTGMVAKAETTLGDVDGDGKLTTKDALKILKFAAYQEIPTEEQKALSDMNADGIITTDDVYLILYDLIGPDTDAGYIKSLVEAGFPLSYAEPLLELHKKYPEWEFEPFVTGLKWSDAVKGENSPHSKQLIENSVTSIWECQCSSCKGVIQEGSVWVSASKEAVEYYLDPRNFLTDNYIFQFETTAYDEDHTIEAVEAILKPTWMYKSEITYLDALGATKTYKINGVAIKYSEAIMKAAKENGMSAYYLASKIVQEVGSSTSSYAGGSSGTKAPYNGIYNYYNIGAYTGVVDGLKWANGYMKTSGAATLYKTASTSGTVVKSLASGTELNYIGKSGSFYRVSATVSGTKYTGYIPTGSVSISTSYGRPWSNPYQSIYYGAEYIYKSFSKYQFTGYLQKFNVNSASGSLYSHEYMANIRAAASESNKVYKAYNSNGILETKKVFSIPVFKDMPNANLGTEDGFLATAPTVISSSQSTSSVVLDWTKVSGATGYQVYKYNASAEKFEKLSNVSELTYKDSTLSAGEVARYKVRAYKKNSDGSYSYSKYSTEFSAAAKPSTPASVSLTSASEKGVSLKWGSVSCTGYQLYRATGTTYTKIATLTGTSYTDTDIIAGVTYKYKVRAYKKAASMTSYSGYSSVITATAGKGDGSVKTGVVTVSSGNLNIRDSASTSGNIVVKVQDGQVVAITGESGEWYKVTLIYDGKTYNGYAHSDYITLDKTKEVCPYAVPTATVSQGSSGDSVKWVQWYLWKLGYLTESGVDGSFGSGTLAAVKSFQTDKKLDVDGKVGPATRAAIISAYE